MGRKRTWVICGQLGLIISFLSIAFVNDPLNNLTGLMFAKFKISFFVAFQDVATDGMAIDVVPRQEQTRANCIMWGSKTICTAILTLMTLIFIQLINFIKHKKHIDGFIIAHENLALLNAGINK